jgi:hypothetical protein
MEKCACIIRVSGTLGGKFRRRQTGTADWDEAKSVVALLQKSGSWDGQDKIEAPLTLPSTNPEPERISVIRAIRVAPINLAVVSDAWILPMRACAYRSNSPSVPTRTPRVRNGNFFSTSVGFAEVKSGEPVRRAESVCSNEDTGCIVAYIPGWTACDDG